MLNCSPTVLRRDAFHRARQPRASSRFSARSLPASVALAAQIPLGTSSTRNEQRSVDQPGRTFTRLSAGSKTAKADLDRTGHALAIRPDHTRPYSSTALFSRAPRRQMENSFPHLQPRPDGGWKTLLAKAAGLSEKDDFSDLSNAMGRWCFLNDEGRVKKREEKSKRKTRKMPKDILKKVARNKKYRRILRVPNRNDASSLRATAAGSHL